MNFYDLINRRQSDRRYDPEQVISREVLERIVQAAQLAPSATNSQPWYFIIVDEPAVKRKIAKALTSAIVGRMNHFAMAASAFIVIVEEEPNVIGKMGNILKQKHFPHMDIGIAASYIALAATEEGLGSCIIGWVDENKVRKALAIPDKKPVPLVISLGYSQEKIKKKKRKAWDQICSYNIYHKK